MAKVKAVGLRIDLGDLRFNFSTKRNHNRFFVTEIDGWWGPPAVRHGTFDPVGMDGTVITESRYGGRTIVLRGVGIAATKRTLYEVAERLSRAFDRVSRDTTLIVYEKPNHKRANVRLMAAPDIRLTPGKLEFQVYLLAPDPRKYSRALHRAHMQINGGGVDKVDVTRFKNIGNYPAYPEKIVIYGAGEPPIKVMRLNDDNNVVGTIRLETGLGGGRYVIYPQTREVWYGPSGSEVRHYEYVHGDTDWWTMAANSNRTKVKATRSNAAAGTMDVNIFWRDSWV